MRTIDPHSLRGRLYVLVRRHDVDLAEALTHRCPEVSSLEELNRFCHQLLACYPQDTRALRQSLDASADPTLWLYRFENEILPFLLQYRLPPVTAKDAQPLYSA